MRQMSTRGTLIPSVNVDKECVDKVSESSSEMSDDSSEEEEVKDFNKDKTISMKKVSS